MTIIIIQKKERETKYENKRKQQKSKLTQSYKHLRFDINNTEKRELIRKNIWFIMSSFD